jgi:beta-lactamase regulating signal transducer with metallopeptidase domain
MKLNLNWEAGLNWLFTHSLQAGVLVLLVLAVQWTFRRRLTNRWRFALWWIVLARLLLPFSPQSALSLFNVVHPTVRVETPFMLAPQGQDRGGRVTAPLPMPPAPAAAGESVAEPPVMAVVNNIPPSAATVAPAIAAAGHSWNGRELVLPGLAILWLAGVVVLGLMVAIQSLRFHRRLVRTAAPAGPELRRQLDDCRREFGVSRALELLETDAVRSPALFGLFRLRLLLPRGFGGQFAGRELRYIFLHELAHVKRGDLWLNWLVTALQILHWFNPLLWLGFARLRADRELACDELALLRAGDHAGTAYGETVIKLLEKLSRPAAIPGLVGILEDKKQMRRRIAMIVNFRRPGRWSVLAVLLLAAVAATALTDAQSGKPGGVPDPARLAGDLATTSPLTNSINSVPANDDAASIPATARPDLTGVVTAKGGAALPVPATVFIATAAPKTGTSTFCPSCYADCTKHAQTDARGNFTLKTLDPQLTFQVLAVAKGYKPKYVEHVDPVKGATVKIELEPIESADATPDRCLRGRVVNAAGQPIEGAVVDMQGIETDSGGSWGMLSGIDPLAVTDEKGEFLITAKKPFEMMTVKVSARTLADRIFRKLPPGKANELVMTEGAGLTGRVVKDGQPLAGVSVGISAVDRMAGRYLGHFEVATGERGAFKFLNLPPDADFQIYTLMSAMKEAGAVRLEPLHTGKDGETTDAGDLVAAPAHRLAGRVVLADGQPLPPKVRLLVSREVAWDSMQLTLDAGGNFGVSCIPDELVTLSVRVKGYHVSGQNRSVDSLNPDRLVGRVDRDITNLVVLLEKGAAPRPDYSQVDPDYNETRQHTLRGAEGVPDHSREWTLSGQVVDAETGQPVPEFVATPGQTDNMGNTAWATGHAVTGHQGAYVVHVNKRASDPMLKVEADGYLPQAVSLPQRDATNVDFALKKGIGPAGTVLNPDGTPAAGATVVMLGSGYNQAGFKSNGELTTYNQRNGVQVADASGHFSFKPEWGIKSLAAAATNGFVVVPAEAFATNATIKLEPLGSISGTLKRGSGPGTNEILDVMFAGVNAPGINLASSAHTDDGGHFKFAAVPAGHLQITWRKMMPGRPEWSGERLQEVDLKPGQALEVAITAPDLQTETANVFQEPPAPKPVPGKQINGFVMRPDGQPAGDADVALQVEGKYLSLGKGRLEGSREEGLLVSTKPDGSFTLPMYEKAQSVVALNEEGYAQVSLEQLQSAPRITLQKWGRIEGSLVVNHHPGTNQTLDLSGGMPRWSKKVIRYPGQTNAPLVITNDSPAGLQPLFYVPNALQARTDEQGRFAFTYVPPGPQVISRRIPTGDRSWTQSQLATVQVVPGQTVTTNLGGTGRTVTGRLHFAGDPPVEFAGGMGVIMTPTYRIYEQASQLKTDAERRAFYALPEVQAANENHRGFSVRVAADGAFQAEDVLPGKYEFQFQPNSPATTRKGAWMVLASVEEFTVPAAQDKSDDSTVNLGILEMKTRTFPQPGAAQK